MTGSGLVLKRKCMPKYSEFQGKRRNVKDIVTEEKKELTMEFLKSGLDIIFKRSIQRSVVNSHTVTYKPRADNPAQLKFNCSGHSN